MARTRHPIGRRARIAEGSGIDSGQIVTIIDPREVPMRKDGSGIPDILGYYSPMDWRKEHAIRFDDGRIRTMFRDRLFFV
jgi:hypothetical protein